MEKTNLITPQFLADPELLTRDEVAQLLHVSLSFIDHLSELPSYKLGKKKLFIKSEVLEYLRKNRTISSSKNVSKTEKIYESREGSR